MELDLLGYVVGRGSVKPQATKVDKILQTKKPETKKELRSFLGTIGFYQKFVDNYAKIAKPLADRLRKGATNVINWDDESNSAFETLKMTLTDKPILRLPDFQTVYLAN